MIVCVRPNLSAEVRAKVEDTVRSAGGTVFFEAKLDKVPQAPTIVFGDVRLDYVLSQPQLRWVQTTSAGVDPLVLGPKHFPDDVLLTNASGVFGEAGAEHILGMMLYFVRGFDFYFANQRRGEWVRDISYARLLKDRTLVVLGLGDIGGNLVKRARAFDMNIIGVRRRSEPFEGVDRLVTTEQLDEVLPLADHLAITLPLTKETRGLLDSRRLGLLPRGAYVYNVGRGAIIDEDALVDALQSGHLGGAGLDVFTKEPLAENHPLWNLDNVLITPHVGADTPWDYDWAADIFIDNFNRFVAGEHMRNVVDPREGY